MQRILVLLVLCGPVLVTGRLPGCSRAAHDHVFDGGGLVTANVAELPGTRIVGHPDAPIHGEETLLWCGTFQLAWNQACQLVGENLRFSGSPPEVVALLNRRDFNAQDLDSASFVAVADFVGNDVHGRIHNELTRQFGGRAVPRHLPAPAITARPEDIVAYAYLFKHLEFATPFERLDEPLHFSTAAVSSFGIGERYKPQHDGLLDQVLIHDYRHQDDFVIELVTRSAEDRLLLAKVSPAATLGETLAEVRSRVTVSPNAARRGDVLRVPRLNFDLTRRFDELEGSRLVTNNPQITSELVIVSALQNVRFQLDERGVRLRSESHVSFGCSAAVDPPAQHRLVFDRPFLIMLDRRTATAPYLALWVGNAQLLVPAD